METVAEEISVFGENFPPTNNTDTCVSICHRGRREGVGETEGGELILSQEDALRTTEP